MLFLSQLFRIKAFDVAKRILKLDPSNNVARNVLKDTAKRMDNVVVDINELNNQRDARIVCAQVY